MSLLLTGLISLCRIFPVHATIIILIEVSVSVSGLAGMDTTQTCDTDTRPLRPGRIARPLHPRAGGVEMPIPLLSLRTNAR